MNDDKSIRCNRLVNEGVVIVVSMLLYVVLTFPAAFADENIEARYLMNFDLIINKPADGDVYYNIQLHGAHLAADKEFHGDDLGEIDFYFTVSAAEDGKARMRIEFYEFETRQKLSDVISEVVAEIEITLGTPARFEANNENFGVDFAFSVDRE